METNVPPAFDSPELPAWLPVATGGDLDALPFGVVELGPGGEVLRYNAAESRLSGLPVSRVLGRVFFRDVAPCCDNGRVAGRFAKVGLDETLEYTLAFKLRPVPVTLRLLRSTADGPMYLLVQWA